MEKFREENESCDRVVSTPSSLIKCLAKSKQLDMRTENICLA